MGLSDIVRSFERRTNKRGVARKTDAGWIPAIRPYRGYGTAKRIHIIGRVLMEEPGFDADGNPTTQVGRLAHHAERGYRQFFTIQVGDLPVTVCAGDHQVETHTDGNGYFNLTVDNHGLDVGWQEVTITARGAEPVTAEVLITAADETLGVISDIDDTVMVTNLPRATLAVYNSWFIHTDQRQPVAGMAQFYREIIRGNPDAPVFYLSTGAWNTYDTMVQFLEDHGFPKGPLLLTDWGPTPTGLFRSGQEHKKIQLRNLAIDYPNITWLLIGDNGQHDPLIYGEFVSEHPDRVRGVAIRELTPTEHVLSHGTTGAITGPARTDRDGVPAITGDDGFGLLEEYRKLQ